MKHYICLEGSLYALHKKFTECHLYPLQAQSSYSKKLHEKGEGRCLFLRSLTKF